MTLQFKKMLYIMFLFSVTSQVQQVQFIPTKLCDSKMWRSCDVDGELMYLCQRYCIEDNRGDFIGLVQWKLNTNINFLNQRIITNCNCTVDVNQSLTLVRVYKTCTYPTEKYFEKNRSLALTRAQCATQTFGLPFDYICDIGKNVSACRSHYCWLQSEVSNTNECSNDRDKSIYPQELGTRIYNTEIDIDEPPSEINPVYIIIPIVVFVLVFVLMLGYKR